MHEFSFADTGAGPGVIPQKAATVKISTDEYRMSNSDVQAMIGSRLSPG
jgi:hypothetical protein